MVFVSRGRARRAVLLGLVVAGLLVGLVGMHHLPAPSSAGSVAVEAVHTMPEESGAARSSDSHGEDHSSLLHLCLAVLTAAALLLLGTLTWRRAQVVNDLPAREPRPVQPWSRGPPLGVRRRLALLCVLRT